MFSYFPTEESAYDNLCGQFITYGIAVYRDGIPLFQRPDIFTDREMVEEMCRLCTREQVEPVHLEDVIADVLSTPAE